VKNQRHPRQSRHPRDSAWWVGEWFCHHSGAEGSGQASPGQGPHRGTPPRVWLRWRRQGPTVERVSRGRLSRPEVAG
jgi:hypothetical protein